MPVETYLCWVAAALAMAAGVLVVSLATAEMFELSFTNQEEKRNV